MVFVGEGGFRLRHDNYFFLLRVDRFAGDFFAAGFLAGDFLAAALDFGGVFFAIVFLGGAVVLVFAGIVLLVGCIGVYCYSKRGSKTRSVQVGREGRGGRRRVGVWLPVRRVRARRRP